MGQLVKTRHAGGLTGARSVMRVAIALSLVCVMGGALGQGVGFQSVPEFEALIHEAKRLGIDPLDLMLERKLPESKILELDRYLNDKLRAEAKEREARIAQMEAQSLAATKGIVAAMKSLDAQGRFGPKAVADLNWLFNKGSEEERALIRRELGKYLKP